MQILFNPGALLRIKNYEFEDGSTKDKYLIILLANPDAAYVIHTLTTSRNKLGVTSFKRGCSVHHQTVPYYCFPAGEIIDEDGFFFDVDTLILFRDNIRKVPIPSFEKYDEAPFGLIRLATLSTEELKRMLKCILKSKFVPQNLKQELSNFKDIL